MKRPGTRLKISLALVLVAVAVYAVVRLDVWYAGRKAEQALPAVVESAP